MISYQEAYRKVLETTLFVENEEVALSASQGRILAETIVADRDFPPFDRATKDGIAIRFDAHRSTEHAFPIEGTAQAGSPQLVLKDLNSCIEVMTGAIVPKNTDTVVMYEHTSQQDHSFRIDRAVQKGQDIHYQGSDMSKGDVLLTPGLKITAAEIGVLASVGKATVLVKKHPKVAVVSTGNELVEVSETPLPYQIRKSNAYSLKALLENEKIDADVFHLVDDPSSIKKGLSDWISKYDVLLLSGGVSKGKYDFLPSAFDELGVEKIFHKVLQRPGKPFWFGRHNEKKTCIFSFPGNPVSTFVGYHVYFMPWLHKVLSVETPKFTVFLGEPYTNTTDLTLFVGVKVEWREGKPMASPISTTGSGDLTGLAQWDGFIQIEPQGTLAENSLVPFVPIRNIL
ncbi:molybdopterin molybdochelatase [Flagellimonas taeanensis]|uniref:Molybdopterin molybdenumtransferase n=1 Tax=Flagellimonas taeanensis TaxID=1005926 RepID=A0A1M6ZVJ0_9FLAO|nr:molybdopterin molybdotransferase MoeA [Allomuricauda taeanensis]MEE1963437.1 molybdopterin molybdotransferase MoeA [Allomuricauda taeanensis]SFC28220.1 molybdopterin molybdochelatase [Allomuricauda taeanensis]SHL34508.1 molybdopterin molybdochelatase [Allomuricauda taeanensis]